MPKHSITKWHVIVPCHNYAKYLDLAVMSVQGSNVDLYVTIVDDASVDDTPAVARQLQDKYGNITYIRHRERYDVSAARNTGANSRLCKYMCFLDADDMFYPTYLEQAEKLLDEGYDVVGPDISVFGAKTAHWPTPNKDIEKRLLHKNCLPYCSAFTFDLWKNVGPLDEAMSNWQDYDFWIRAALFGAKFINLPGRNFCYRKHGVSKSLDAHDTASRDKCWEYIKVKYPHVKTFQTPYKNNPVAQV